MKTILLALLLLLSSLAFAKPPKATRHVYSGTKHTESHGGSYTGGAGSSHRNGHYRNPKTHNHYGTHKPTK